ncbi:Cadherin domain protein [Candidatus Gugararchaeum adminiculabundum]|nr:Cadherin domain protein [Candidatus Gugararchaeum adminiculabundum]
MGAYDGAYNSPAEIATYSLGLLGAGSHTINIRCTDSAGNTGASTSASITVTGPAAADTTGPVVSNVVVYPGTIYTTSTIIVNATGSDASTGNSNISTCQLQVDGGSWNTMTAIGGTAYNTNVTVNVSYTVGTLSCGIHYLNIRCTDSASNTGATSSTPIAVNVIVGDTQPPIVTSLSVGPSVKQTTTVITVNATGSDLTTGNSNITSCELQVDSGSWNIMTAVGSAYGTNVTQTVNYSVGTLGPGGHTVSVRCTDSASLTGTANTTSITVADGTGPIVTSLAIGPSSIQATTVIRVNATGSDATTGGSNISLCQLQVDGGAWNAMAAYGGSYNTQITQNANYSVGTLSTGSHTIGVRCNDSSNNFGATNSTSITVEKGMVIITLTSTPNANEVAWINYINAHTSPSGYDWSLDNVSVAQVTGGTVDITGYKIVVLADAPASNVALYTQLNNYANSGNYVVLLGAALTNGPLQLGIATATCTSASSKTQTPRTAHYIDTGYTIGTAYTMHSANRAIYYCTTFTGATNISTEAGGATRISIGDASHRLINGETATAAFSTDGDIWMARVLDYAIANSN